MIIDKCQEGGVGPAARGLGIVVGIVYRVAFGLPMGGAGGGAGGSSMGAVWGWGREGGGRRPAADAPVPHWYRRRRTAGVPVPSH